MRNILILHGHYLKPVSRTVMLCPSDLADQAGDRPQGDITQFYFFDVVGQLNLVAIILLLE